MSKIDKELAAKWVATWKIAASSLQKVKGNELRSPDYYEKSQNGLDEMLQYACDHAKVRLTSGLVEQQQIFSKFRKNPP